MAENLRNTRKALRISRAKLAENAGVSVPYLADIERRRTWVSDKTLQNLAEALNLEPYELLCAGLENKLGQNKASRMQMAEIVTKKKNILRKTMENVMEDLILELVKKEK